jgi:hypothetical protein
MTPEDLESSYKYYIQNMERSSGKKFGGSSGVGLPLLLSVRSGKFRSHETPGFDNSSIKLYISIFMMFVFIE